jgi:hypothetical protein
LLSSAILYVAIVAIWACVLIPRWLRRDSSVPTPSAEEQATDEMATAAETTVAETTAAETTAAEATPAEVDEDPAPRLRRRRFRRNDREDAADERRPVPVESRRVPAPGRRVPAPGEPLPAPGRRVPAPGRRVPAPGRRIPAPDKGPDVPDDRAHRRVLSARRRLLAMLVVLTIGSGALAGTKLAAWWVILPPSVMLLGYLVLLRAAGKADAERRERAFSAAAEGSGTASAAPPSRAEVIDISASRDPRVYGGDGIQAGQRVRVREELYDQDEDAKLRAVGD